MNCPKLTLMGLVKGKELFHNNHFQKRWMSNYYFPQQPTILKQQSQILSPLPLQQSNYTIIRSTLTDRSPQEIKPHPALLSPVPNNVPALSREGSFKQLHENMRPAPPTVVQSRSSGGIQNQRTFSDYQISPGVRVEEQMLPVGGGYNISSKIGERIKHKTDLHKSSSKGTLNGSELNKAPSIRYVQSVIEADRNQFARLENIVEIINSEIAKINERVNIHEEKIDRMERSGKKSEEGGESVFSTPQMQEINKILSLVQRSEQRDDYRKAMKMIEELRTTILELNTEIKGISEGHSSLPAKEDRQLIKKELLEAVNEKSNEIRQTTQIQIKELGKRLMEMEDHWKHWTKDHQAITSITSSVKKFEGKMTTFHYEQKLTPSNTQLTPHNLSTGITKPSISPTEKQNAPSSLILTSKTYYIDSSGYLLDKNKYYLLNHRNEQIRLSDREIQLLRKHNIL